MTRQGFPAASMPAGMSWVTQGGIERVRRGIDLDGGGEERVVADLDLAHVQHDAVEIEEHSLAEQDIGAAIADERRLHPGRVSAGAGCLCFATQNTAA